MTMRTPSSSASTLGIIGGTSVIAAAPEIASAVSAYERSDRRLATVGGSIEKRPSACSASATSGAIHCAEMTSRSSCTGCWPAGAAAKKNRVS